MAKIDYIKMQKIIDCVRDFGVTGTLEEKGMAFDYLVNFFNHNMKNNDNICVLYRCLAKNANTDFHKRTFRARSKEASIKCDEAEKALNFMVELLGLIHAGYKPTGDRNAINEMKDELAKMNNHEKCKYYGVVRFEESAFLPCDRGDKKCSECSDCVKYNPTGKQ